MRFCPDHSYCFAVDGPSFEVLCQSFPEVLERVCVRGAVFARMSPDQKQTLVEQLQVG